MPATHLLSISRNPLEDFTFSRGKKIGEARELQIELEVVDLPDTAVSTLIQGQPHQMRLTPEPVSNFMLMLFQLHI